MFLKDCWYVAATADEIGAVPLARTLLNEAVVLYRTGDEAVAALEDRCCNRHLPLLLGKVVGDRLQCGYHGLEYDAGGACVRIPGQTAVPPGARIRSYPVVERWGWIWMGDADAADEAQVEDFHWLDDPGWRAAGCRIPMDCDYRLGIDNLLDLSHLTYVYRTTLGNAAVVEAAEVKTERYGPGVRVTRWMIDVPAPPMYRRLVDFGTNIDRWQIIDFSLPCFVKLDLGGAPTGTGARQGDRSKGFERKSLNALTPETETTIHYFRADAHNFDIDKPEVTHPSSTRSTRRSWRTRRSSKRSSAPTTAIAAVRRSTSTPMPAGSRRGASLIGCSRSRIDGRRGSRTPSDRGFRRNAGPESPNQW